jgi:tryptophan synthase alpha chain
MDKTLDLVRDFRAGNGDVPIVLMGYYNPIYIYGTERFVTDAAKAGVDGLIVVDMPPEEDEELRLPADWAGLNFIRLTTPTSDEQRLPALMEAATGFVYYVSVTGITGTRSAASGSIKDALVRLRQFTALPIAVGFGIKTPEQAADVARSADAAVVGSAIVQRIADAVAGGGKVSPDLVQDVLQFVSELSDGVRGARGAGPASVKEAANT